jgi:(p)ppGpp synthase/HD superfamily hydrolase
MLTDRFDDAFNYAHRLHRSQMRKGTTIPYISHLMTVAALVIEHGGNEDQAIAALLHDAAEDQGGAETLDDVRQRFGDAVAEIVSDCTDAWTDPKPEWRTRKEAYLAKLPAKPTQSLLVSLADKTHNAEAILFDYRILGETLWPRFNGGAEGTRWYYGALADLFSQTMPGRLSDRLSRAVKAFSI